MSLPTILEAIEHANNEADIRTLKFANIKEFNSFMDSFNFDEYPINIVIPFDDNGTWIDGRRKAIIPIQGWVLTRLSHDTDIRSKEAEQHYIAPMRQKAKKFLLEILDSDLTDPEVKSVTDSIRPEYAFLSELAFGVSYRMNWPISEKLPC